MSQTQIAYLGNGREGPVERLRQRGVEVIYFEYTRESLGATVSRLLSECPKATGVIIQLPDNVTAQYAAHLLRQKASSLRIWIIGNEPEKRSMFWIAEVDGWEQIMAKVVSD